MALKPVRGKIESQELNDNFSYLDDRVSKIITTPAEGISEQEIIDARDGFASLGDKLRDKLFMTRLPWLDQEIDDLDYIWERKDCLVDNGKVMNSPHEAGFSLLETVIVTTTVNSRFLWLVQRITDVSSNALPASHVRSLSVDTDSHEIRFKSDWIKQLDEYIRLEELPVPVTRKLDSIKVAEGAINWSQTPEVGGFYGINGNWIDNNNFSSYKVDVNYNDKIIVHGDTLTIIGFDETGNYTEDLRNNRIFTINNINTKYITIPIRNDLVGKVNIVKGDFFPSELLSFGEKVTEIDGLIGFSQSDFTDVNWVALGTSMTARGKYTSVVEDITGMILDNRGVGSGGITSSASAGNTTMQAIDNLEDFKGLLTVEIGPNDSGHPLGEIGDTDESTFYGCLYTAFNKITQKTTARCVVLTMSGQWAEIDRSESPAKAGERRSVKEQWSRNDYKSWKMQKAIKEMAEWFSFPVIDVKGESGLGGYHLNNQTSIDWIHHSDLGGKIVGEFIAKQLVNNIQLFPGDLNLASDL